MAAIAKPNFTPGLKEIFLPKATVTLMRMPYGPNFAKFRVPLAFSKLDLRDYLWHGYGVAVRDVRVYVKQQRVRAGNPDDPRPQRNRWHRPQAHKHMTVELERPFVWPEEPEDYSAWNKDQVQMAEKNQQETSERTMGPMSDSFANELWRDSLKAQAKELLEGRKQWTPPAPDKTGGRS